MVNIERHVSVESHLLSRCAGFGCRGRPNPAGRLDKPQAGAAGPPPGFSFTAMPIEAPPAPQLLPSNQTL
jgi:hypothetical protein